MCISILLRQALLAALILLSVESSFAETSKLTEDRVLLVGEAGVGKSTFAHLLQNGSFPSQQVPLVIKPFSVTRTVEGKSFSLLIEDVHSSIDSAVLEKKWQSASAIVLFCSAAGDSCGRLKARYGKLALTGGRPVILVANKTDMLVNPEALKKMNAYTTPSELALLCREIKCNHELGGSTLSNELWGSQKGKFGEAVLNEVISAIMKAKFHKEKKKHAAGDPLY